MKDFETPREKPFVGKAAPARIREPVLVLKKGTIKQEGTNRTSTERQRRTQQANIAVAKSVAECLKSSLGPNGMYKMVIVKHGEPYETVTKDGAKMLRWMFVQNPIAKVMVGVSKAQDESVGDGTIAAVVLAGELLGKAEDLINLGVHPTIIAEGYTKAAKKAMELLGDLSIKVDPMDREILKKVAVTSQSNRFTADYDEKIARMAVDAVLQVAEQTTDGYKVDVNDVRTESKTGGSLDDTSLIRGVVLDKQIMHNGMPKRIEHPKIALLNCPLEIRKTKFDLSRKIHDPKQMRSFLDGNREVLRNMIERIAETGASLVICQKDVGEDALYYLARRGITALRKVKELDMDKLAKATAATITNVDDLTADDLGSARLFEEILVRAHDRITFIEGCSNPKSVTILIRGGLKKVLEEAERSIHKALCVVRDVVQDPRVVGGGGGVEFQLATQLRKSIEKSSGKETLAVVKFAEALESIPLILAENAGLDPIDILAELRFRHEKGEKWAGIDAFDGGVKDMIDRGVYEPASVKEQMIISASETARMILRIDDLIRTKSERNTAERETENQRGNPALRGWNPPSSSTLKKLGLDSTQ